MAAFLVVLMALAAGALLSRTRVLPENTADVLNRFVIWVCLPAIVVRLVPRLSMQAEIAVLVVVPWASLAVAVAVVLAAHRVLSFPRPVLGALLLCAPLGNTSFLGFPMIEALVGPDATRYALPFDQLGSFLILTTYGSFVVARFSSGESLTLRAVCIRILKFPPFVALVVALVPFPRPPALEAALARIGDALLPIAVFAVGFTMKLRPPAEGAALAVGLSTKMIAVPLAAFALSRALGLRGEALEVAVLEAGMPPMITAGALAMASNLAPALAAALVGYGILLALPLLPFIAELIR